MEAPLTLRRPANWQDFETLCKKLWGEIWNCPEIKKNGRPGQQQHGVDIYGTPFGEEAYYGIQCKGKDEYTHKQFTNEEITEEIEKAKLFQPALKKLYLTTTAVKDGQIEQFAREKNIEHKLKGLFEVHIFSWEDIVDLIDENKHTHDWYVKSQGFKIDQSVSVTFRNGLSELILTPKFKQRITHYKKREVISSNYPGSLSGFYNKQFQNDRIFGSPVQPFLSSSRINLSYCVVDFHIKNTGSSPIEDYKMGFQLVGDIEDLKESNKSGSFLDMIRPSGWVPTVYLWKESNSGKVVPRKNILVGDDTFISDDFYIKPASKEYDILVQWKLISRDFKEEGELILKVQPHIEKDVIVVPTDNPIEIGAEKTHECEDFIVEKNEGP